MPLPGEALPTYAAGVANASSLTAYRRFVAYESSPCSAPKRPAKSPSWSSLITTNRAPSGFWLSARTSLIFWPRLETTVLFGIRPRSEGTGDVESLFSYFLRLAHEHRLTPRKLVDVVLREVVAQIPQLDHWRIGWGWDKNAGRDIVGSGQVTRRWVKVLGVAAGQAGLEWATMLGLSDHVSGDLLAADDRVCLRCLSEDMAKGELPYGRLLWRMKAVSCCPTHRSRLVHPTCGRGKSTTRAQFSRVKLAGVCNQCGSIGHRCTSTLAESAGDDDVWRAEQCRQLIAALPSIASADPRAVPQCLKSYCAEPGALTSLALRSGATLSVLSRWMNEPTARLSFVSVVFQ